MWRRSVWRFLRIHPTRLSALRWCGALLLAVVIYINLANHFSHSFTRVSVNLKDALAAPRGERGAETGKCSEIRHIAFIKVHKCGSSIIENINLRFGMSRNLTFMLPQGMYMIEYILHRPWTMFLPPPKDRHFDILTHHAVYNKLELERHLPNDTVYTAILRHPFDQMRSALYYFNVIDNVPNKNISMFLEDPHRYFFKNIVQMVVNTTSYELGVDPSLYTTEASIKDYLNRIENDFILVVILDRLEESLVLMKRYLCWKLEDILVMKKNVNRKHQETKATTSADRKRHREIALADYLLYELFAQKLDEQIIREGEDFAHEVKWYIDVNARVVAFCIKQIMSQYKALPSLINIESSKWNDEFTFNNSQCVTMSDDGLTIVNTTKIYQYGKADITRDEILSGY